MALKKLFERVPCFNYNPPCPNGEYGTDVWNSYSPCALGYVPGFIEKFQTIWGFFFCKVSVPVFYKATLCQQDPELLAAGNYYFSPSIFGQCPWPGWSVWNLCWDMNGNYVGRVGIDFWTLVYMHNFTSGCFGTVYAMEGYNLKAVDGPTLAPNGISFDTTQLLPSNPNLQRGFHNYLRSMIVGVTSGNELGFWDYDSKELIGKLQLPEAVSSLVYEDENNVWVITTTGLIAKANYEGTPRWEILSGVQNPTPDVKQYFCAFDPVNKRVAVYRWLPDSVGGDCRNQAEFYRPLYLPTQLTDPVPMNSLEANGKIDFVAHLIGENGKGCPAYNVEGELGGVPTGFLRGALAPTELNGAGTWRYQAPAAGCTEVLNLSVTVEDA